jgi:hypothetical protein
MPLNLTLGYSDEERYFVSWSPTFNGIHSQKKMIKIYISFKSQANNRTDKYYNISVDEGTFSLPLTKGSDYIVWANYFTNVGNNTLESSNVVRINEWWLDAPNVRPIRSTTNSFYLTFLNDATYLGKIQSSIITYNGLELNAASTTVPTAGGKSFAGGPAESVTNISTPAYLFQDDAIENDSLEVSIICYNKITVNGDLVDAASDYSNVVTVNMGNRPEPVSAFTLNYAKDASNHVYFDLNWTPDTSYNNNTPINGFLLKVLNVTNTQTHVINLASTVTNYKYYRNNAGTGATAFVDPLPAVDDDWGDMFKFEIVQYYSLDVEEYDPNLIAESDVVDTHQLALVDFGSPTTPGSISDSVTGHVVRSAKGTGTVTYTITFGSSDGIPSANMTYELLIYDSRLVSLSTTIPEPIDSYYVYTGTTLAFDSTSDHTLSNGATVQYSITTGDNRYEYACAVLRQSLFNPNPNDPTKIASVLVSDSTPLYEQTFFVPLLNSITYSAAVANTGTYVVASSNDLYIPFTGTLTGDNKNNVGNDLTLTYNQKIYFNNDTTPTTTPTIISSTDPKDFNVIFPYDKLDNENQFRIETYASLVFPETDVFTLPNSLTRLPSPTIEFQTSDTGLIDLVTPQPSNLTYAPSGTAGSIYLTWDCPITEYPSSPSTKVFLQEFSTTPQANEVITFTDPVYHRLTRKWTSTGSGFLDGIYYTLVLTNTYSDYNNAMFSTSATVGSFDPSAFNVNSVIAAISGTTLTINLNTNIPTGTTFENNFNIGTKDDSNDEFVVTEVSGPVISQSTLTTISNSASPLKTYMTTLKNLVPSNSSSLPVKPATWDATVQSIITYENSLNNPVIPLVDTLLPLKQQIVHINTNIARIVAMSNAIFSSTLTSADIANVNATLTTLRTLIPATETLLSVLLFNRTNTISIQLTEGIHYVQIQPIGQDAGENALLGTASYLDGDILTIPSTNLIYTTNGTSGQVGLSWDNSKDNTYVNVSKLIQDITVMANDLSVAGSTISNASYSNGKWVSTITGLPNNVKCDVLLSNRYTGYSNFSKLQREVQAYTKSTFNITNVIKTPFANSMKLTFDVTVPSGLVLSTFKVKDADGNNYSFTDSTVYLASGNVTATIIVLGLTTNQASVIEITPVGNLQTNPTLSVDGQTKTLSHCYARVVPVKSSCDVALTMRDRGVVDILYTDDPVYLSSVLKSSFNVQSNFNNGTYTLVEQTSSSTVKGYTENITVVRENLGKRLFVKLTVTWVDEQNSQDTCTLRLFDGITNNDHEIVKQITPFDSPGVSLSYKSDTDKTIVMTIEPRGAPVQGAILITTDAVPANGMQTGTTVVNYYTGENLTAGGKPASITEIVPTMATNTADTLESSIVATMNMTLATGAATVIVWGPGGAASSSLPDENSSVLSIESKNMGTQLTNYLAL